MQVNHFLLIDNEDNEIASNLEKECINCYALTENRGTLVECPLYKRKRRNGKIENNKGNTFLCCATTKTTKLFKAKLDALSYASKDLKLPLNIIEQDAKIKEQKRVNRLVHNLTSINAKNIQEIYDLVPQEVLASDFNNQLQEIIDIVKKHPKETAMMFLRIAKHNIHMKSEFSIYRKLDRAHPTLEFRNHPIHKVLMNVLHSFFIDFSDKEVYVMVGECRSTINCDYETLQVALYHLIENASKYVRPKSKVEILFKENKGKVAMHIKMNSLYIEKEEYEKVFVEGYSGKEARKTYKDGDGIGMWRIKQMLELNKFQIKLNPGIEIENLNGFKFAENEFIINF